MHGLRSRWKILLVAAWALSFLGIGLHTLAEHGSDVPLPGEWATEAAALYRPWLHRPSGLAGAAAAVASADPGARMWKLVWLRLDGQWDPRLLASAAVGLFTLAGGIFFSAVIGELSALGALALAVVGVSFPIFPGVLARTLDPGQAWAGLLLLFSLAHLAGTAKCRPASPAWWMAQGAGFLNVLSSTAGLASPLAALAWIALGRHSGGKSAARGLKAWNTALVILGLGRALCSGGPARGPAAAAAPLFNAWPLSFPGGGWIICGPAFVLIAWTLVRPGAALSFVRLLCFWILIQTALLAGSGILPPGVSPVSILAFGLWVQFAAVVAFPADSRRRPAKILLGAAWLILIYNGLFQQSRPVPGIDEEVQAGRERAAAVRRFLADGAAADLAPAIAGGGISAPAAASLLADPLLRAILPASIRPGLALADGRSGWSALGSTRSASSAAAPTEKERDGRFAPGAFPDLGGKPALLPAWGTWSANGPSGDAQFVSEPLASTAPMLQIYVAGLLAPPARSLVLRAADGREISALEPRADALSRWKQLNFVTPGQPFQVVARSAGSGAWLAFSAPVEAGRFSWLGRKAVSAWPVLLGIGLILFTGAGAGAALAWQREHDAAGSPATLARGLANYAPWLALFTYGLLLANFIDTCAAGADASGYLNSAKLLLHGHLTFPPRRLPGATASLALLAPLGFGASHGSIVPGYPVGLPLLLAAAGRLLSLERAVPALIIAHLLLGVFFTRRLAEVCGLPRAWAWIAAGMVALCPLYVFMGLQPMSDGPSLVWVTASLYFALASRTKPRLALAAGAAAALAVLLRPANVICLLPVVLALGWSGRRLAFCAAGGLPGALFASWYNHHLYGSAFATGYGDIRGSFSPAWVGRTLRHYAHWLTACLTPVVWLALLGPCLGPLTRSARIALTAAVLGYLGFYAFYCFTHETWWYLRFVLPVFPCLTILALAALQALLGRAGLGPDSPGGRQVVAAAVLLGLLVGNVAWQYSRLPVLESGRGNAVYRRSALWAEGHLPNEAVILAYQTSGAVIYYTRHPIVRAEAMNTEKVAAVVRQLLQRHVPVYALVFRFDSMPAFSRLPGRWESVVQFDQVTVWRLVSPDA